MSLYERYETLSPIYKGGLTNHLPMVLVVLQNHKIDNVKIIQKLDRYHHDRGIFDLSNRSNPITDFEQEYINRTSYYLGEMNRKGKEVVIGEMINKHDDAISSALMHGIIRLSYAVKSKEDIQIAQALAYFEVCSTDLELDGVIVKPDKMAEFIEHMRLTVNEMDITFPTNRTMDKIETLLSNNIIKNLLFKVEGLLLNKGDILDILLTKYLETEDFYVLHLITGFHAIYELEEYFVDFRHVLVQYLLMSEVIMLLNTKKIVYDRKPLYTIDECISFIGNLDDAHDIKLMHSVYELSRFFDNRKLALVANTIIK